LLDRKASLVDQEGDSYVLQALEDEVNDTSAICKLLIVAGADCLKSGEYDTPLHLTSERGYLEVVRMIIETGADVNALDDGDRTPLMKASSSGHADVFMLLIEAGANAFHKSCFGNTAFIVSCSLDISIFLFDAGADVCSVDDFGKSAMHNARNVDLCYFLVSLGLDINKGDEDGNTPLHFKSFDCMKVLLALGADILIRNNVNHFS
jgi:ankyrin repeat protein